MLKNAFRGVVMATVALGTALAGSLTAPATAAYSGTAAKSLVPDGTVHTIVRAGDRVYIGGSFTRLRNPRTGATVGRSRVAAFNATTGNLVLSFNPGANDTVRSISVGRDGTVYLGGEFTAVGGRVAHRIAAVRADGSRVPGWTANADGTVLDVWAGRTGVYAAGSFNRVNGVARSRLVRLRAANGSVVTDFNARVAGGRVQSVTPAGDGGTLLLGGTFTSLSGRARGFAGAVSFGTGAARGWAPERRCDTCYVVDLTTGGGRAYAAMAGPGGRVVAWSLGTGSLTWVRRGDGDGQALDYRKGLLYVGGHFGPRFAGAQRHQLAVFEAGSGTLRPFRLAFTGRNRPGIFAVVADGKALRIGGGFQLARNPAARYAYLPNR